MGYAIGLLGMWLFTDGVFSIVTVVRFVKHNNKPWDQFIRLLRCVIGIAMMVMGALI